MFDVNLIAAELSNTFKNGLPSGSNKEFISKLIFNNVINANQKFNSSNPEYDENKKYFICRVVAYTTCEIYNKLHENFQEKQLDRICNKSTSKICNILKQPLDDDSPENEIMTMIGFVLPVVINTEIIAEKLRFNPVSIVKLILSIPKHIIRFVYLLSQMRKMAQDYYKK